MSHGEAARCRSTATVRSLAADLGMSKDTVARALARLSAAGIVVAEQQTRPRGHVRHGQLSHHHPRRHFARPNRRTDTVNRSSPRQLARLARSSR